MKLLSNKKGFGMDTIAMVFGALALVIVLSIGGVVLSNLQTSFVSMGYGNGTAQSAPFNATRDGLGLFTQYSGLLPTVGIIMVATLILGLIVAGLGGGARK